MCLILLSLHAGLVITVVWATLVFGCEVGIDIDANVNTVFILIRHLLLIVVHIVLWLTPIPSSHGSFLVRLTLHIVLGWRNSHHFRVPLSPFLLSLRHIVIISPGLCLGLLSTHVFVCLLVDHALGLIVGLAWVQTQLRVLLNQAAVDLHTEVIGVSQLVQVRLQFLDEFWEIWLLGDW